MPEIEANGLRLRYDEAGEGPPLVLISGLGQNRRAWAPVLPHLAGRRCITFDNRGTGASSVPPGPYRIEAMAEDTAALIEALGTGPVDIAGWSLGGAVLQALMLARPELVRRAALVATLPSYTQVQHHWLDAFLALRRAGAPALAQIVAGMAWGLTPKTLADHDETLRLARAAAEDPEPTSLAGFEAQAAGLRVFDSRAELGRVRLPVLVLCGAEDVLTPPAQSAEIAALIPGARLQLLPRGGHRVVTEYPIETAGALRAFFDAPG